MLSNNGTITSSLFVGTSSLTSTTTTTGALKIAGGVGIVENLNIGGGFKIFTGVTEKASVSNTGAGSLLSLSLTSTTAATTTIGALVVAGGANIADNLLVGTTATVTGITTISTNATSSGTNSGALIVTGGVGVGGAINAGGIIKTTLNTNSTTTDTGALLITGGAGIGGAITVGGAIKTTLGTNSTTTDTGALIVAGGAGIGGAANIGGILKALDITNSTSIGTGALVVSGGIGVSLDATIGGVIKTTLDTNSTTISTGALIVGGGAGIALSANIGGVLKVFDTTIAATNTTGSLVIMGGVHITKNTLIMDTTVAAGSTAAPTGALAVYGGVSAVSMKCFTQAAGDNDVVRWQDVSGLIGGTKTQVTLTINYASTILFYNAANTLITGMTGTSTWVLNLYSNANIITLYTTGISIQVPDNATNFVISGAGTGYPFISTYRPYSASSASIMIPLHDSDAINSYLMKLTVLDTGTIIGFLISTIPAGTYTTSFKSGVTPTTITPGITLMYPSSAGV